MKNDASLWRDLRQIKFRYIALVGICLVGGGIYRGHSDDPVSDDVVDLIDYDNEAIYLGSEHDYADYSNEDRVAEYIEQYMEGADYNDIKNLGDVRTLIQSLKLVGGNGGDHQAQGKTNGGSNKKSNDNIWNHALLGYRAMKGLCVIR